MTPDEIDAALYRARLPAIAMLRTPKPTDSGTPGCWFGGEPTLPPEYDWPIFTYPTSPYRGFEVPMHFVVQINLQYLPRVVGLPELPTSGTLFVFYDPIAAPLPPDFAREPDPLQTGEGVQVIYHAGDVSDAPPRQAPPLPDLTPIKRFMIYEGNGTLPYVPYDFVVIDTYDYTDHIVLSQVETLQEHRDTVLLSCPGWGKHETSRFPQWQDVSLNTIFGASSDVPGPHALARLKREGRRSAFPEREDKVLLFRLPSAQIAWGDETSGLWIDPDDLTRADFSKVSLFLEAGGAT